MAIKGKKKSGQRGSQARRRPAAAPRPVVAGGRPRTPWYNTPTGRVVAALLVVLVIAGIGALVAVNRSNARDQEQRREQVEEYASELSSIVQSAATPVGEMSALAPGAPADQLETLAEDAEGWVSDIEAAASRVVAAQPPEPVAGIHPFFQQSFQLYTTSARLLIDAADAAGKAQQDLLTRSAEVRSNAEAIWAAATASLDAELAELGGDPSGLQSPGIAGASAAIPVPDEGGGEGENSDGSGGGNGGGGSGGGG